MDEYEANTFANRDAAIPVLNIPTGEAGAFDDDGPTVSDANTSSDQATDAVSDEKDARASATGKRHGHVSIQDRMFSKCVLLLSLRCLWPYLFHRVALVSLTQRSDILIPICYYTCYSHVTPPIPDSLPYSCKSSGTACGTRGPRCPAGGRSARASGHRHLWPTELTSGNPGSWSS